MPGGRPPQPLEVAKLKGATRVNPARYEKRQASPDLPLGQAPDYLSEAAKAAWFELESWSIPGVLKAPHRPLMEVACLLIAELRGDFAHMPTNRVNALRGCLSELGLTPVAQNRLGIEKPEKDANPYSDYV